jgi:hypothetical protein
MGMYHSVIGLKKISTMIGFNRLLQNLSNFEVKFKKHRFLFKIECFKNSTYKKAFGTAQELKIFW